MWQCNIHEQNCRIPMEQLQLLALSGNATLRLKSGISLRRKFGGALVGRNSLNFNLTISYFVLALQ